MRALPRLRGRVGSVRLPWGLSGLALLSAAVLAFGLTPRWQAEVTAADQALQALVRHAAGRPPGPSTPPAPTDDQRLLQALPPLADAPQRVAELLALAQQQGLVVDSTRQTWAAPAARSALPLQRLQLVVSARGPYLGLRRFVAQALQHDPTLVLDQLQLSRPPSRSGELGAELHWSLLQRDDHEASR